MAEQYETPAEREAKLSAQNARINEAVAEDVALGMAEKAAAERQRANAIAQGNIHLQREADAARFNSIYSQSEAAEAKRDANNSKFGFWLLATVIAASLLFGSMLWANRKDDVATANSASQPPLVTRTIVVSPSPATSPTVVREYVPVPVPVRPVIVATPAPVRGYVQPVPQAIPSLAAPSPEPTVAAPQTDTPTAPTTTDTTDKPLNGYIER